MKPNKNSNDWLCQDAQRDRPSGMLRDRSSWLHLLLLLGWLVIGVALRFTNLAVKPASSIEIATLGFSLGHDFSQIPLDQVISTMLKKQQSKILKLNNLYK